MAIDMINNSDACQCDEELRRWLEDYLSAHQQHPTSVLSRAQFIGVSRSALDAYVRGRYFLSAAQGGEGINPATSNIEHAIRAYRERVEGTVRHGYANTFVETGAWRQLRQACEIAIRENVIVVIYGKPGVGKSRCLMEYAVREMKTAPLSVLCSRNITIRYFVQQLARGLNLDAQPVTAELEDMIAQKLMRYPRVICIDQANYLNERCLGTLCHLWEKAHVPVCMIGTRDLYELFTTSRMTEDVRAQLSSRVALHYMLSELTIEEVKGIVEQALGDDATAEMVAQIYNVTGAIHRHVDMILPRILDLKARNEEKLRTGEVKMREIVNIAGSRLMTGI